MQWLSTLFEWLAPALVVIALATAGIALIRTLVPEEPQQRVHRQLSQFGVVIVALILLALVTPLGGETRGQLLSLFGLLLTGILGLASTTFVSNAMAGFMLRSVSSFRTGDFVSVGEHFGRVTETALLHTEIQSEDRDLITLPNLFLITQPVRVVRASGTLISADVSLGYDLHRQRVRDRLIEAATDAALNDAFVQIIELGDYAISYRVSGFLEDVGSMVSKRSELRSKMLDRLHEDGIEIVSPSFMNQRSLSADAHFMPRRYYEADNAEAAMEPEKLMFDKAELAMRAESFRKQRSELVAEIKKLKQASNAPVFEIEWRERQIQSIDQIIGTLEPEHAEPR